MSKKFLIITDGWKPQVSGVVTVVKNLVKGLEKSGNKVILVTPKMFITFPLPTYSEIRLSILPYSKLKKIIFKEKPDYIHIVTEGTLGLAGVMICNKYKLNYTTASHTKLPEYINLRTKLPVSWGYKILRLFHKKGNKVLVSNNALKKELEDWGFEHMNVFPLGVDTKYFRRIKNVDLGFEKPIFVYLGRVAIEKNIETFLKLDLPGTKIVIGDGPQKVELEEKYKNIIFYGYKSGKELVKILSGGDVFVFPSLTDTFGLVILEAMACGLPVAAFNVVGPKDLITNGFDGYISNDLKESAIKCLDLPRINSIKTSRKYSWDKMIKKFIDFQVLNTKEVREQIEEKS